MDKLKVAHDYALEMAKQGIPLKSCKELGWKYADAMQAEAEKRNKAEAEQKRKEVREMLNADNTLVEREGRHFDDLTPTWDQGPNVLTTEDAEKYKNMIKREFDLYNNPPPKIEKRKSIHVESLCEVDWNQATDNTIAWFMLRGSSSWLLNDFRIVCAPSFGFTGSHIVERPHGF